jgi:hypothetical protein
VSADWPPGAPPPARPPHPQRAPRTPSLPQPGQPPPRASHAHQRERSPDMLTLTLRYARYALSCLSAVAFKIAIN